MTILMMIATSCGAGKGDRNIHERRNSVYYWKTVFHLDEADREFLKRHDIGRIYLRMFDVVTDRYACGNEEKTVPNATVRIDEEDYRMIRDSLTGMEFVPVVYITLDALKAMEGQEKRLASNIVTRVRNMCRYNGLPNVNELQLDCDWTTSTEKSFFNLCDSIKQSIATLELPWRLSSTIRLHQLSRKAPPVDNGVLMVYNTGSFNDPDTDNSIIDADDVRPYLKHLSSYPIHLDVAYPTYSWQLLFRKRRFLGLLNGQDLSDTTRLVRKGDNTFVAKCDFKCNGKTIREGDMIREETSGYEAVKEIKDLIERKLDDRVHSNIIYHLDSGNLSKYKPYEIDQILSSGR